MTTTNITLKQFNNKYCKSHNLILIKGNGYLYWSSDDDNVHSQLCKLYSTSVGICHFCHGDIKFWEAELANILKRMANPEYDEFNYY